MALPLAAVGAIAAYRAYKIYKAYKKLKKLKQAADAAKKQSKAVEAAKRARRFSDKKKKSKQRCPSDDKCLLCGRKRHDKTYERNSSERRKTLMRDADDPESGLSERARQYIRRHNGKRVPRGHEVSHEKPLYTVPHSRRCTLDKEWNMKTMRKSEHRQRHKKCGDQFHDFPQSR